MSIDHRENLFLASGWTEGQLSASLLLRNSIETLLRPPMGPGNESGAGLALGISKHNANKCK
jgi:hypothetical protein